MTNSNMFIDQSSALLWLEFGGQYTDSNGNRVIDNLATRGDAPKTVKCGDGIASNTFPTQHPTKRGIIIDTNAKYVDTLLQFPTKRVQPFSLFALLGFSAQNPAWAPFGTRTTSDSTLLGFDVQIGNNALTTLYCNDATTNKYMQVQSTLPTPFLGSASSQIVLSIAVTYSGSGVVAGVNHYANGSAISKTTLFDGLGNNDFASLNTFKLGKRPTAGAAIYPQTIYAFMLLPREMTPLQVSNLHKKVIRRINTP